MPEKCDLNSILFLLTPAEDIAKMQHLVALIARFEQHIEQNSCSARCCLRSIKPPAALQKLHHPPAVPEMHDLYVSYDVKELQRDVPQKLFRAW
ncbi:hypothetical protein M8494_25865 [Serratia ureilytica]